MNHKVNKVILNKLNILCEYKVYHSNVWLVIIPNSKDYVYKLFNKFSIYKKELDNYILLKNSWINVPKFEWLWRIENYFIIKLENIRKDFIRKEYISELGMWNVAHLLRKIHNIEKDWKRFLLWDIHVSNFFEIKNGNNIKLWVFDFSSSYYWFIESDISDIYIDIDLDDSLLKIFLDNYWLTIDYSILYKYTIRELYERIKNWMNLWVDRKNKYIKFLVKLKKMINEW